MARNFVAAGLTIADSLSMSGSTICCSSVEPHTVVPPTWSNDVGPTLPCEGWELSDSGVYEYFPTPTGARGLVQKQTGSHWKAFDSLPAGLALAATAALRPHPVIAPPATAVHSPFAKLNSALP